MCIRDRYKKLGLIYQELDGTLVIAHHSALVGSESASREAIKKRNQRQKKKIQNSLPDNGGDNEGDTEGTNCPTEYRDKSIEARDKENREKNIADLLTNYTLSKETFSFADYSEDEKTRLFGETTLTVAEYCELSKYIREYALNTYCKKLKDYPDCEDRFKLVLTWAIKDDNLSLIHI